MHDNGFWLCKGSENNLTELPDVVKLLPRGTVTTQKGDFVVDEDSYRAMKEQMQLHGVDIVIDYEHQTLKDIQAPAAGWIKELLLLEDAIAAKVEWTPTAQKYIKNKEYRYLSPVVKVGKKDNKAWVLHSAGLTNTPAIDGMYAIVNSIDHEGGQTNMEFLKKIAQLLNLPEDAAEEQIMAALTAAVKVPDSPPPIEAETVANKEICTLLDLKGDAKPDEIAARIKELKDGKLEESDLERRVLKLQEQLADRDANDAVTAALKDGKITPAQKDWAKTYALKDPGGFASFVDAAPQVVPMGEIQLGDAKAKQEEPAAVLAVCKQLGVSQEDLEKYGKGL